MKTAFVFLLAVVASICLGMVAQAQSEPNSADTLEDLKLQLIELSAQEEAAKLKAQQLDELLKPENIEHSLAGIGSTKPEELREQRRRQLTIQKTAVTAELEQLTRLRSKLETSIAAAEVQAYQQSAKGMQPVGNYFGSSLVKSGKWLVILLAAFAAIGSLAGLLIVTKLRRKTNGMTN